ncbi:MAG: pyruvate kinase [Mycobacteriaceae bacterium]
MNSTAEQLDQLQHEIGALLDRLADAELKWRLWTDPVAPEHRSSAINLVHYWALRQSDLRDLQIRLAEFGLSSLGRSEAHVQATLLRVAAAIAAMRGPEFRPATPAVVHFDDGPRLLARNAEALMGPAPVDRAARIMVTLPTEAATDRDLVDALVSAGMGIARINCAHDDRHVWTRMAGNVRAAADAKSTTCLVAMDLAGPKLRTGPLQPGPKVVRLRPTRNTLGQAVFAAHCWMTDECGRCDPPESEMITVPVDGEWLERRREGDELVVRDTRGSKRRLLTAAAAPGGFTVTTEKTTYLGTGTEVKVAGTGDATRVGELPETEQAIVLEAGDVLRVTLDCSAAPVDERRPASIGCTLPEIFQTVEVGHRILFDDGKLAGKVIAVGADHLDARIERPSRGHVKLRGGKGINLPDTDLLISALTDKDVEDLATVAKVADIVDVSFVREPSDVIQLFTELRRLGAGDIGVVLKIETQEAFDHLPQLLLTAMRRRKVGVMIARGDLAVESGYERMAELQEETLWLCEAAHLPVIWATQVLEQLAKTGQPSRAEITDAAMSERAECVMLNKGPFIVDAVVALDDILGRMARHEYKSSALLPGLHAWGPELR